MKEPKTPTHRCKTCGARWWRGRDDFRVEWILCSDTCGPCCGGTVGAEFEPVDGWEETANGDG